MSKERSASQPLDLRTRRYTKTLQRGRCSAGGCECPVWGKGLEMGSLGSPAVTSYKLPMVSHRFRTATACHGQMDGRTDRQN